MFGTRAIPATTVVAGAYAAPAYGTYAVPGAYAPRTTALPMATTPGVPVQMPTAAPTTVLGPPASLTAGIPNPAQIEKQKAEFTAALEKQLKDAVDTVQKETQIEKEMVRFNAEKQISLYNLQVDEKLTEMCAVAAEQATISDLELKKAKIERGLQLDGQAQGLMFDYNMKATQQELATKQAQFAQQYMTEESKLAQQYAGQMLKAALPGSTRVPMTTAVPTTAVAPRPYAGRPMTTVAAPAAPYSAFPTTTVAPGFTI